MDAGLLGKVLLAAGIAIALVGAFLMVGGRLPFGRLPGDISIQGQSGGFFFPVVSCIVISVVLTVLLNFIIRR
jgi:ABC-type tungstate transport system substrate-binding protein